MSWKNKTMRFQASGESWFDSGQQGSGTDVPQGPSEAPPKFCLLLLRSEKVRALSQQLRVQSSVMKNAHASVQKTERQGCSRQRLPVCPSHHHHPHRP